MEPKIDSVVLNGPNGHRATVSGPINWDSDETGATFAAAITQVQTNGHIVLAAGENAQVFTPSQARWSTEVDVVGAARLTTGLANGWATASVLEQTGAYEAYPWEVDNLTVTAAAEAEHGDVVSARRG